MRRLREDLQAPAAPRTAHVRSLRRAPFQVQPVRAPF